MDKHIIFVIALQCFAAVIPEAKTYRNDYMYNWRTDAFYKLHIDSDTHLTQEEVCELEGAKLMAPMSNQELSQVRARINQYQEDDEEDIEEDLVQLDSDEAWPTTDLEPEAQNLHDTVCQVITRDGYVRTSFMFHDTTFICKVPANDVYYDSQCKVHAKGYRYVPSLGSCYKFSQVAYTWYQAAAECQAEGAHLVVINSEQEAHELKAMNSGIHHTRHAFNPRYLHIGFRAVKITKPRVFKTIFNETLPEAGFNKWARTEPNNIRNDEHCGSFYTYEAKLNDVDCHRHRYDFICENEVVGHGK